MKKIILLLFFVCLTIQTNAYDRVSIVERFTNASCVPCAQINASWYNTTTQQLVNSGSISHVIYNGWWPGSNDPMYLLNQTDNTTRIDYYGVNAVPQIHVNGSVVGFSSPSPLINAVNTGNSQFAPFNIEIIQVAHSTDLIDVRVKITRDPTDVTTFGNVKLRFAITERIVSYSSPPGSNGERDFFSVCRKMLPDAGGSTFTIPAPGDFVEVSLSYVPTASFRAAVDLANLRFVAFIQDDTNKYIYQSVMLDAIENYVSNISAIGNDALVDKFGTAQLSATIGNIGLMDDSYYVNVSMNSPTGWTGEYTTMNGTFQFGYQDLISVPVGQTSDVNIEVTPNGINGYGEITIEFVSFNEPGVVVTAQLRTVVSGGVEMLVVDASGSGFGSTVINSLDNVFTGTFGMVSRTALIPGIDLTSFYEIIWTAGDGLPAFYPEEVTALQAFLDDGGRLLINGQDIGKDIFDPAGQSQFAQDFYHNYLHAEYVSDFGLTYLLTGYAGDPISNGFQFILNDVYERSPDEIMPYDVDATAIFKFLNGPRISSIRTETEDYRVVYLGFGIEQITDQAIKDTLVARSIAWLKEGLVVSTPDDENLVHLFSLEQNYPNPFNPNTTINYYLEKESLVSLKVYDIMGSEVVELVDSRQSAGSQSVQFDASSLASGMYLYKLTAGEFVSVKKMTLLK